ncbi:MAG: ATP-binding protein [Armatimonadota bacterium]|nr:ATP-binding protein [Armatimonadota bacterium]MDR7439472.1 ATP-binding protein [Armatimonadota bacterium]MDR7562942.1 ATP-binding protein [Armatimonadota bacterium]MDR7568518.1 ATP-binding protein [Armatimonadota bacterium]MDR7602917.1 ATP-binding protein [Armatimonadota bacterium]
MSLRGRLLRSYLVVVTVALLSAGAYVIRAVERRYMDSYTYALQVQARLVAEGIRPQLRTGADFRVLEERARQFAWRRGVYIGVRDPHGRKPHLGPAQPPPPHEVLEALQRGEPTSAQRWDSTTGEVRLFAAYPVVEQGRVLGVVHVSAPRRWVDRQLVPIWWAFATAGVLALVVSAFFGFRIARSIARPLKELERAAEALSRGEYTRTVPATDRDEVGRLGLAFNRLGQRLQQTIEDIRAERNRLEAVLAAIRDAVVAIGPGGEIQLYNRAAEELLGLRPEALGRPVEEALGGSPLAAMLREAAGGKVLSEELALSGESGRVVEVSTSPIRAAEGRFEGAVAVVRDVTELRRTERMRRELIANVGHELRTPLTSIKGFAETLLAGALHDAKHARKFLEIIELEANRLMKLVDDLLDLSRLETKGVTFELRPVDLDGICRGVVERTLPRAEEAGIRLTYTGEGPLTVLADPDRVEQVLTNLVDNALKFTPEGGEIHVQARQEGTEAVVSVQDTGRGIPPDDLPHIFERFYRADRSRTRREGGSGLGLAIAKHLVEMQGGRIWASSRPGEGSAFCFSLPLVQEDTPDRGRVDTPDTPS